MRKLIINADDLGISSEVNAAIEDCIRKGVITSSTLMANAPAFDEGVKIAKQNPQISVGVHLNIIEFAPLTNTTVFQKHGMLDVEGNFIEGAAYCVKIDKELRKAICEEWEAQIDKVIAAGIIPTHIDSHQHTHTIQTLQDVLCRLLEKYKIKKVRRKIVPSIRLMLRERKQSIVQLDKSKAMKRRKRNVVYRRINLFVVKYSSYKWNKTISRRFVTTNSFYAFRHFYENRDVLHLGDNNSVIELMCHPGHKAYKFETEYLIKDKSWQMGDYELISYRDL